MHSFSRSKLKARVSRKSWRVWLSMCLKATLFFFSYCIGFNMLHSKLQTLRRFILLLVRCVKFLRLLNTTMQWLWLRRSDLKKTCKSGKLSIPVIPRVFAVFPSSGPITIIVFCHFWFSPCFRKRVESVLILHGRSPRAHVRHVIREANSTTKNGLSFLKVLTLISLFSLQSVTVFNIKLAFHFALAFPLLSNWPACHYWMDPILLW